MVRIFYRAEHKKFIFKADSIQYYVVAIYYKKSRVVF